MTQISPRDILVRARFRARNRALRAADAAGRLAGAAVSRQSVASLAGVAGVALVYRGLDGWSPELAQTTLGGFLVYVCWAWSRVR